MDVGGKPQVVVNATGRIRGYDLAAGTELWSCSGMTANAIPTPVSAGGVLYVTSGYRGASLMAIKLGVSGDLSEGDAVLWRHSKNTPYVSSPLLVVTACTCIPATTPCSRSSMPSPASPSSMPSAFPE